MPISRRSVLVAASGLAAPGSAWPVEACSDAHLARASDAAVSELLERSARGHAALMRGDLQGYREWITLDDDFTLMSPFGGRPSHASAFTPERLEAIARYFRNGTFEQEVVQTYSGADMMVLAIIERQHVEVGGLPAQLWPLRVTLVYRRHGSEWRLAHRHADPLVNAVSLEQAAALARGEAT